MDPQDILVRTGSRRNEQGHGKVHQQQARPGDERLRAHHGGLRVQRPQDHQALQEVLRRNLLRNLHHRPEHSFPSGAGPETLRTPAVQVPHELHHADPPGGGGLRPVEVDPLDSHPLDQRRLVLAHGRVHRRGEGPRQHAQDRRVPRTLQVSHEPLVRPGRRPHRSVHLQQ